MPNKFPRIGANQGARFSHCKKFSKWQIAYALSRWSRHSIVCPQSQILVGFTPKAGCSFAAKVFFDNTPNHNTEDYEDWPHPYRQHYQRKNPTELIHWLQSDITAVKFVRNPFSRAVSSYFQAMRTQLKEVIGQALATNSMDWSFHQFLCWLASTRLDFSNPHFGPQKFWGEGSLFHFQDIIKIEEVSDQIVLKSGKKLTVAPSARYSRHHVQRGKPAGYCGDLPFSALQDEASIFPDWQHFYNCGTSKLVAELYKKDFLAYDYPLSITN